MVAQYCVYPILLWFIETEWLSKWDYRFSLVIFYTVKLEEIFWLIKCFIASLTLLVGIGVGPWRVPDLSSQALISLFKSFNMNTWSLKCNLLSWYSNGLMLKLAYFRLQTGMRGAFGKPQGTVARVRIGQPIMSVRSSDRWKAQVIEALRRAKFKFPGRQKVW